MLPTLSSFRERIRRVIHDKSRQGHVTDGLEDRLKSVPDSYDALHGFARELVSLPLREDWPYVEPNDWEGIRAEFTTLQPAHSGTRLSPVDIASRIETAFLSRVCGCMLGKPLEFNPTLEEIREALTPLGLWPLREYLPAAFADSHDLSVFLRTAIGMDAAVQDDDLDYTILGLLTLEQFGADFSYDQLRRHWLHNIAPFNAWGPERNLVVVGALRSFDNVRDDEGDAFFEDLASAMNPGEELCGAMIRADAYGYAAAGNPELAARLAWKDASFTHRRTGIYGSLFAAAAIAAAPASNSPLEIFETAIRHVPRRSRFYHIVSDALSMVSEATDWLDGYRKIHGKYKEYAHCQIHQEAGTLINTLRFAEDIGDGLCKQVMQGNDTDSYGATAGSILGMYFGPGHLDSRWLAPLNDTLQSGVSLFHEHRLSQIAHRMSRLPEVIAKG